MNPNNNSTNSTTMQQQQQYKRPFQSLTQLSTNGPYQKLQFHIIVAILSIICCLLSSTVSATATTNTNTQYQYHLRHLEDNNSGDNNDGWTGEWNGEWTATDDMSFECDDDGGCKQTKPSGSDSSSTSNSMWYDNGDLLTPEQIITYVSLGALTFMTLLCCLCYPEIITVGCNKCLGRNTSRNLDEDIENGGGDYVGGKLEDEGKKKKKSRRSRSSSKTRSSSRSRSGRSSSRSRSSKKRSSESSKDVEMTQTQTQLV